MNALSDKVFKNIKDDFAVISKIVLKQLQLAKSLTRVAPSEELIEEIYHNEHIIDSMEVKIRSEIINTIVLYSPRATNLRKIISYYDMTAYLERIGDLILNVSKFLRKSDVEGELFVHFEEQISALMCKSENMVQNAIFAFTCKDNHLAKETIEMDDAVDEMYHNLVRELQSYCCEKMLTQQQMIDTLSINSMAYNLERISDNATNIAESAIFLIEGVDIKHHENVILS
ncbi:MAG: phosphate signaling complex PhoU family protein [Marinifilaceae bacterium]